MTRSTAIIGGRREPTIERALRPLAPLNQLEHDDADIREALTEGARRARDASELDRQAIRAAMSDRLALLRRDEWSPQHCKDEIASAFERAGCWTAPVPLDDHADLPRFPLEALPAWLGEWVAAEAHATQTPPEMAAMLALAVIATACQRVMTVRMREDWLEPACIYTAVILPPGSRKSAVMRDAREPLDAYEREQAQQLADAIARSADTLAAARKRLDHAIGRAARAHGDERIAAQVDLHNARNELAVAESGMVHAPQLTCGDTTQEALATLLQCHGECIALLDAEGCGPLSIMAGRYTDGSAAIDLYLRAHARDVYRCNRVNREPIVLRRPTLTMAITTQPEMLRQLGERREMRGLGLIGRILWVMPVSMVGRRSAEPQPMAARVREAYASRVRALLALERNEDGEPYSVHLSAPARMELRELEERIEPRLGLGGDLEHIADWAGKLAGAIARIAALLHAAEHSACPWGTEISADTMRRAILIGECLLAHAQAALGAMGADPALADARHILGWLVARDTETISKRDLWHALRGRYKRAALIEPGLAVLQERGYIRIQEPTERRGPGRPSVTIELSPLARRRGRRDHGKDDRIGHIGHSGPSVEGAEVAL